MIKNLIKIIFTSYLLLASSSLLLAAGSDIAPPTDSAFGQLTTTPTSIGVNLSTTDQSQQLQSISTLGSKLTPNTTGFPLTIPIPITTPLSHLINLSTNSDKFLPILHIKQITDSTPTKDLTTLAFNLNNPQVVWESQPIIVFGSQLLQPNSDTIPKVSLTDTASTYTTLYNQFSSDLNPDKYTLIPAQLFLRSTSPTPMDWINPLKNLYDTSPAVAIFANHFNPSTDPETITQIKELLGEKDYFFTSFNFIASANYTNQVDALTDFATPEGTSFANINIPNHCNKNSGLFFFQSKIFTSSGGNVVECLQTISINRLGNTGIASISVLLSSAFTASVIIAVIFVFFMLIIGGYRWITAGGDKTKVDEARQRITNAIIGLAIVTTTFAIMTLVGRFFGVDISNLEIPSASQVKL